VTSLPAEFLRDERGGVRVSRFFVIAQVCSGTSLKQLRQKFFGGEGGSPLVLKKFKTIKHKQKN
jgi:hypothetical protein